MLNIEIDRAHFFGLAVFKNQIYWTDWLDNSVHRADRYIGESNEMLLMNLEDRPMDIHVYHRNRSRAGKLLQITVINLKVNITIYQPIPKSKAYNKT